MQRREHLTTSGLQEIIKLRASLNLGLSDELKAAFPKIIPANKPKVENQIIPHPQWVTGFSTGEGCFSVGFSNDRFKYLSFKLTQHSRDEQLMMSFIKFWGCGYYYPDEGRGEFKVQNFPAIKEIIIPFFKQNPILGVKALDFQDWCLIASLVEAGKHKTEEGTGEIRKIKARMNTGRKPQDT